ncbi:MAG TPA: M24 family metallopeptidase, partial [Rhizobiales bacterium]|nr:M24 family metallopeptidase [Hyphomicrobiales bacterium]
MFQSYDDISEKDQSAGRIAALRAWLADNGLDGFILHRGDEFQGEYVAAYAGRLSWLTGFTGSAGVVIVLKDKAAIFVDGRYTIQVKEQTDDSVLTALDVTSEPPAKWLAKNVSAGEKIAFDPWLLTTAQVEKYQKQAQSANARLVAVDHNPVDAIWTDQPARPSGKIFTQPIELAGRAAHEKIAGIQKQLNDKKAKAVVLTLSDSVSWLFNIRGSEIAHNPVVLAFAIVPESGKAQLFLDAAKVPDEVHKQLERTTTIEPPENFAPALARLAGSGAAIMVDPDHAASAIITLIEENGGAIIRASDPCILPKACKNEAELNGARAAHRRDGAVMARFLSWLAETAPDGGLDEVAVAKKLEALRAETGKLRDISFDTISAAGPHAAIPHYRVTTSTSLPLEMNRIYLVDSGAQYEDGTTDITRTVITGTPTAQMKDRFTRVLKGMINLTLARFPEG